MRKKHLQTLCISVLAFLSLVVIGSCRKSDQSSPDSPPSLPDQSVFFNSHVSADPFVIAAHDFVKDHDGQFDFSGIYAERIGLPYWDKSIVMKKQDSPATGDQALVFIPFVRKGENRVSASMLVRITEKDTSFRMIYASKASIQQASAQEGRLSAVLLMSLDKNVFGYDRFQLTDEKLLKDFEIDAGVIKLTSRQASLAGRMVYYTVDICYEIEVPRNNGQLFGCPPGDPCPQYETQIRCDTYSGYYDDGSDDYGGGGSTGGGSSTGGGGGGGGGSTPPPPNPCPPQPVDRVPEGENPCPGGPTYTPIPPYTLSAHEASIFQQMEEEDEAADAVNQNCLGTNRTGNVRWPGTLEHWLIQIDYLRRNLTAQVEYQIPGASSAGNGNVGYADIVNTGTAEIFEIKPNNSTGLTAGQTEVALYVTQANIHCAASSTAGPWKNGTAYTTRLLPDALDPSNWIQASLIAPGVIGYKRVPRATNPLPAPLPTSVMDKLKDLVRKLREKPNEWKVVIAQYMHENPDLVTFIKGAAYTAAVAIIVGTIVEDFATFGGGLADDWACFLTAYRVVRFAWAL